MEIILKQKKVNFDRVYKLTKTQIRGLITKEKEDIGCINNLKIENNLVFYSIDYGYCLIRHKADKLKDGKEVWLVDSFLDRDRIHQMYLSEEQIRKMISVNIEIRSGRSNKIKGYMVSCFRAILQ
ncbi:hypothetical protein C4D27_15180 [Clostridium perfringens]